MFGGHCLYCDGVVFALVAGNTLYLKVDNRTRPRFERLGLQPFRPFEDKPEVMQFYPPPAEFFEDSDSTKDWGGQAVEVGHRAATKKKRPR
jgi:DNA transformation protein